MSSRTRAAHGTIVAYLALFVALSGTGAYAVDKIGSGGIKKNAIKTRHIGAGQVKLSDVGSGAVNGAKVANNSLTAADLNETALGVGVGLVTGRTPGNNPFSTSYLAPSGTTTAILTSPDAAARLSPQVPTEVANLTVSADVPDGSTTTVALIVNGLASSLGCDITAPATTCIDDAEPEVLPAGSRLAIRVQFSGSPPTDLEFAMTVSPIAP
jgi:hypothetical protein